MTAIVNIGQMVTLAGPVRPRIGHELRELGIIENAALLIGEDGCIEAAGTYADIKPLIPPGTNEIDAERRLRHARLRRRPHASRLRRQSRGGV